MLSQNKTFSEVQIRNKVNEQKAALSPMLGLHKSWIWFCVIMLFGPEVCFILAFVVSWPLGPKFVDEGSITKLRLAIATLAFGQLTLIFCIGILWSVVINQLRRLTRECGKLAEKQP